MPFLAIAVFVAPWGGLGPKVQTSLGAIPGPAEVWEHVRNLHAAPVRMMEDAAAFHDRHDARNAECIANGQQPRFRGYMGAPTYHQQIWTSIKTVFFGFIPGTIVAVPLGIAAGLSPTANAALNPLIQVFKPVLPPTEGSVSFKGVPITGPGPERGMIFQNCSLMPWRTVNGNVDLAVDTMFPNLAKALLDHPDYDRCRQEVLDFMAEYEQGARPKPAPKALAAE
ncbi:MAG: hypothetical protein Kow0013_17320 [Pararhodobacter sp.]